jgi:UDP-glucuronate 4-epimerase
MKILVTGGAGFIGSHLCNALLAAGHHVTNIDNFDTFYDKSIKLNNIVKHKKSANYKFIEGDILNLTALLNNQSFDLIIHLAAKAGVRPSLENPIAYHRVNVEGTLNLLEYARHNNIPKFIFASSSSVYGENPSVPWRENDTRLMPISPYAASKISAELLGKTYATLFGLNFIALRFFTVYGPGQRPDLAIHKFFKLIYNDKPITVFGDGSTMRDYTFIDDIVSGIMSAVNLPTSKSESEIFNLGNSDTIKLTELISEIENIIGKKAIINSLPEQTGDVSRTFADISKSKQILDYNPKTKIADGLKKFNNWYIQNNKK